MRVPFHVTFGHVAEDCSEDSQAVAAATTNAQQRSVRMCMRQNVMRGSGACALSGIGVNSTNALPRPKTRGT